MSLVTDIRVQPPDWGRCRASRRPNRAARQACQWKPAGKGPRKGRQTQENPGRSHEEFGSNWSAAHVDKKPNQKRRRRKRPKRGMNNCRRLGRLTAFSRCYQHSVIQTCRISNLGVWPSWPMQLNPTSLLINGRDMHKGNFVTSFRSDRQLYRLKSSTSIPSEVSDMEVVYVAPLKGAVRAIKVFSLCTAVCAFFGSPVLVWLGNPSVPVAARVMMSSLVMGVGVGTTGLLHWLLKGYVMKMAYNRSSGEVSVHTLSVIATQKQHNFQITEAGPPSKSTAFSTFQANGKSFFMHTEVFKDRQLLSKLLGAYSVFESGMTPDQSESKMASDQPDTVQSD